MHLFVYGTLLTGIPSSMSRFLLRRARLVGKATIPGKLYDLGMYPGYIPGDAGTVKGELFLLNETQAVQTMEMLNAYESVTGAPEDEYKKVTVKAKVGDGGSFEAMTYEFTKSVEGKMVIPLGDYGAYYPGNKAHERFVNGE
ncbi:MAG: gamma-glutamylcyclotransferase (GGCT)/AIG2-like uncharacterized protein YtfP [Neolewinella sp.]|jgi:gamma-glutamylcyclotransferase (GGCT)/AIG2-like uncharacterized protein YtfP